LLFYNSLSVGLAIFPTFLKIKALQKRFLNVTCREYKNVENVLHGLLVHRVARNGTVLPRTRRVKLKLTILSDNSGVS